jgi:endonuclease/exonuclease/phosphatase family metal-dependent hydrolase
LGLSFPGAAVVLAFGMAVGVLVSAFRCSGESALLANTRWWYIWRLGLALAVALGVWWFWSGAFLGSVGLMLGVAASVVLFTELLLGSANAGAPMASGWAALCFTLGLLIEVGLLFAYYTFSGSPQILIAVVAIFVITCLIGAPARTSVQQGRGASLIVAAGVLGGLLLLISAWEIVSWNDPSSNVVIGPDVTVMTYNIQSGFSATHQFDLDATAKVIEAQHPDIVVLQEVSRGWLVTSGIDEVVWLSQRLKMNYAFGSNSDDGLWGNIILSRAPIESTRTIQYSVTQNLKRSVIEVQLPTQSGDLWVLGTHLDDPRDAGQVRLQQTSELISTWDRRTPALVLGDMNSDPTDPVITQFLSAGLVDYGAPFSASEYTSHDQRRIDYIFGTDNIALRSTNVPDVWTSDHRPVVAHLTLPPDKALTDAAANRYGPD